MSKHWVWILSTAFFMLMLALMPLYCEKKHLEKVEQE